MSTPSSYWPAYRTANIPQVGKPARLEKPLRKTDHPPAPHFGLLSNTAVRDMDEIIKTKPWAPALNNINLNAAVTPAVEGLVLKNKPLLTLGNFEIWTAKIQSHLVKGMRPGQHLYVAPSNMVLGDVDKGYRRYSVVNINPEESTVTLLYRRIKNGSTSSNVLASAAPNSKILIQGPHWNGFVLPPRHANVLAFAVGIANVGPMQFLLKTRLLQQEGSLGHTSLFSTYQSPEHEIPKYRDVYEQLENLAGRKFSRTTSYSIHSPNPSIIQGELGNMLHIPGSECAQPKLVDRKLQDVLQSPKPLTAEEKRRLYRLVQQMGTTPDKRKETLDMFLNKKTYVYICGILDVEQTVKQAFLLLGAESGKLSAVRQHMDQISQEHVNQWRFEGVRKNIP